MHDYHIKKALTSLKIIKVAFLCECWVYISKTTFILIIKKTTGRQTQKIEAKATIMSRTMTSRMAVMMMGWCVDILCHSVSLWHFYNVASLLPAKACKASYFFTCDILVPDWHLRTWIGWFHGNVTHILLVAFYLSISIKLEARKLIHTVRWAIIDARFILQ